VKEADAACGVGARVWDAGVGLSIWLQRHSESCARAGKAVLELGSGVGVGGISAALAGAAHVTLSDLCGDEERSSSLGRALAANARRNGVSASAAL